MQDNNLNVLLETMNKVIDTLLQEKLDLKVEIKLLKEKIIELELKVKENDDWVKETFC